jgi:NagD protein
MLKSALNLISLKIEECAFIGDRMDTDILCGIEASMDTILVLSGVSKLEDLDGSKWSYHPRFVLESVGSIFKI